MTVDGVVDEIRRRWPKCALIASVGQHSDLREMLAGVTDGQRANIADAILNWQSSTPPKLHEIRALAAPSQAKKSRWPDADRWLSQNPEVPEYFDTFWEKISLRMYVQCCINGGAKWPKESNRRHWRAACISGEPTIGPVVPGHHMTILMGALQREKAGALNHWLHDGHAIEDFARLNDIPHQVEA